MNAGPGRKEGAFQAEQKEVRLAQHVTERLGRTEGSLLGPLNITGLPSRNLKEAFLFFPQ
jgi:hypothetical protein